MREGLEGLLEVSHRLAERGTVVGPGTGLLAVGHGLVPHLAPNGMMGEPFHVLIEMIGMELLHRLDEAGVERASTILEQSPVRHFVRERVFERVLKLREKPRFVEEFRRLQAGERFANALL